MKKKLLPFSLSVIFLLSLLYLLLPPPILSDLPQSRKSTEPGDTTEIPGLVAYYTDWPREQVTAFYQESYVRSSLWNLPLLTIRLNHPVEYARETIRPTLQSSFFEEFAHPLRESLYVNGYEWENDPFAKPEQKAQNKSVIDGREYKSKITVIQKGSPPLFRLFIFLGILVCSFWLIKEARGVFGEIKIIFKR